MQFSIKDEKAMEKLGESIAAVLESGDTLLLTGVLGAGKTTLVRGIARGMGYQGRVTSPTFTLLNIYPARVNLYHFDFYRLDAGDIGDLGLEDYLERDCISLVEWPQAAGESLPTEAWLIDIALVDDDYERERQVTLSAQGEHYREKLKELEKHASLGY